MNRILTLTVLFVLLFHAGLVRAGEELEMAFANPPGLLEPETGTWKNTRQIDSRAGVFEDHLGKSGSRCSYPNGYDYGPRGKLHVTWVWRESSQGANHDLMYSYSADLGKTWRNNLGEPLPEPPGVDSPAIKVVDISQTHGLMNTHGQTVDSQGRIHVVMWHCTDESLQAAGSKAKLRDGMEKRFASMCPSRSGRRCHRCGSKTIARGLRRVVNGN